jgi:hypothetical protein
MPLSFWTIHKSRGVPRDSLVDLFFAKIALPTSFGSPADSGRQTCSGLGSVDGSKGPIPSTEPWESFSIRIPLKPYYTGGRVKVRRLFVCYE